MRRLPNRLLGLLLCVAARGAVSPHRAQAQTVQGTVTDGRTNQPLSGVRIRLLAGGDSTSARAETAADGRYLLLVPQPGRYRVRFEVPGYRMIESDTVELRRAENLALDVSMKPLAAWGLDTVVVHGDPVPRYLADFYRRKHKEAGTFLTREDLDRFNPLRPTDLVPRLGGFSVTHDPGGGLHITNTSHGFGLCPPLIFLDGAYVGNSETFQLDDALWVDLIVAVESYRRTTQIPVEFNYQGSGCGVIAIWIRR